MTKPATEAAWAAIATLKSGKPILFVGPREHARREAQTLLRGLAQESMLLIAPTHLLRDGHLVPRKNQAAFSLPAGLLSEVFCGPLVDALGMAGVTVTEAEHDYCPGCGSCTVCEPKLDPAKLHECQRREEPEVGVFVS